MYKYLSLCLLPLLIACSSNKKETLFKAVNAKDSGVSFVNEVVEDAQNNVLEYQYFYNGGGVAIGDVNGDGLADIYFTGNMVENKLYLNKGKSENASFHFEDITQKAGVNGRKRWKTGVSMADVNADGKLDIYVCYSGTGTDDDRRNELYINQGNQNGIPVFKESAKEYGLDAPGTYTTQVAFFDMDNDGDLDMFMVNHADMFFNSVFNTQKLRNTRHNKFGNRLYRNDNGHFNDVSKESGIDGSGLNFGLSVAMGDVNSDGWSDLYVTNDYDEQDFLYINEKNGHFKEVTEESFGHLSKFSMGSNIVDLNNDLRSDLITLDMLPESNERQKLLKGPDEYDRYQLLLESGFYHQNMRNMLHINQGNTANGIPVFSEVGQLAGVSNTDWSWCPLAGDFDNDGRKDLYITNGYLRDFTNLDFLKFTYEEENQKAQATGQKLNTWQLIQQMSQTLVSNYGFSNQGDGQDISFKNVTESWGLSTPSISTGAAYADLDNDGDLDLVINNSNQPALVYENREQQQNPSHYLRIQLAQNQKNTFGIGAKIVLHTASGVQTQTLFPAQGFQSCTEPIVHFGLGKDSLVTALEVYWTDGKVSKLSAIKTNQLLKIDNQNAAEGVFSLPENPAMFEDFTDKSGLNFTHQNLLQVDFKQQILLPYQLSKLGPFMAVGDVNGDGLEDAIVGGNYLKPAVLYFQQQNQTFKASNFQPWNTIGFYSDMGLCLFDADGDNDLDLFIARGNTNQPAHSTDYQDVIFANDGKGNFSLVPNALPDLASNGSCVVASDYDKDGDLDLFVGGRSMPGRYPEADFSYLLKNQSANGQIKFAYASEQKELALRQPGLVNSAAWIDLNKDGWIDLVVAGEFMPITVFENHKGQLQDAAAQYGLDNSHGMWQKIVLDDIDNDGDIDIIAGNLGLNTQLRASQNQPMTLTYGDFDQNGVIEPVISYFIQGKSYPLATLDEFSYQMPSIKKKFLKYKDYSQATLNEILSDEQRKNSKELKVQELNTTLFVNNQGKFTANSLPITAQNSWVSGIVVQDFNKDGKKDLLLAGNFYPWKIQLGKNDASKGIILLGKGNGSFSTLSYAQTKLLLDGDVRGVYPIKMAKSTAYLFTRNEGKLGIVR
jgi:hypothetical protein